MLKIFQKRVEEARLKSSLKRESNGGGVLIGSGQPTNSLCSSQASQESNDIADLSIGAALYSELANCYAEHLNDPNLLPVMFDGGPNFNWHAFGLQCLGEDIVPSNCSSWISEACVLAAQMQNRSNLDCDLPMVNLLWVNSLQRFVIAINLIKLLLNSSSQLFTLYLTGMSFKDSSAKGFCAQGLPNMSILLQGTIEVIQICNSSTWIY